MSFVASAPQAGGKGRGVSVPPNSVPANPFEDFQWSKEVAAERRVRDLSDAMDDLTTLSQTEEGIRIIKACRPELAAAMLKLNDLLIETMQRSNA